MKTVIIDGNNLMHKVKHLGNSRGALAEAVKSRVMKRVKLVIVFDGHSKNENIGDVIFSGDRTADDVIRKYIEDCKNPADLTVVSSDTDITGLARTCGCTVKGSGAYWQEIDGAGKGSSPTEGKNINQLYQYDDEKPSGISRKDLKEFKKYFT